MEAEGVEESKVSLQALEIGNALRQFGAVFASPFWKFEVTEDQIVGRVALPELQGLQPIILPLAYLDKDVLIRIIRDVREPNRR